VQDPEFKPQDCPCQEYLVLYLHDRKFLAMKCGYAAHTPKWSTRILKHKEKNNSKKEKSSSIYAYSYFKKI
jgi:hypothetical protein